MTRIKTIEDCWGATVSKILAKPNLDFTPSGKEILVDELVLVLGKYQIHILPVAETDEIAVEYVQSEDVNSLSSEAWISILEHYLGRELSMTWYCNNSNGYSDLFITAFNGLQPNLAILSEGSVLKLFSVLPIEG